ncbi:hypothetical protein FUAX_47880 (plasmid) [Fulvitalea axinellae]|uniref:EF-hand domain-containing protein n=1 Tax=Fulvitalea axinellae TaxID=1182444 RepID=A0AAU9DGW0_9BACT|nr:hypothetical protein FUAX_47880 [Fulvitalea axinellae]
MKNPVPYKSLSEALDALDNGGRFFNFFTKAHDGVISSAEVEKAGGFLGDIAKAVLFMEMSLSRLSPSNQKTVLSRLDKGMRKSYVKYRPQRLSPEKISSEGKAETNIILTGVPRHTDSKTLLSGTIQVPIQIDGVMTFLSTPILEEYEVYEVGEGNSSEVCCVAIHKEFGPLPKQRILMGGQLKELQEGDEETGPKLSPFGSQQLQKLTEDETHSGPKRLFLDVTYFIELDRED